MRDSILISEKKIVRKHKWVWRSFSPDYAGMCGRSGTRYCAYCNAESAYPGSMNGGTRDTNKEDCITYDRKYLERPEYLNEHKALCSIDQREKAIEVTIQEMIRFVKKNQKHNLTRDFISGTTSLSSQAFDRLMKIDKIVIENGFLKINKV